MRLAEQRRALNLLADAGPRGSTAAILMAHGFTAEMLAGLVRDGLATVATETVKAGGRTIEVAREDYGRRPAGGRRLGGMISMPQHKSQMVAIEQASIQKKCGIQFQRAAAQ